MILSDPAISLSVAWDQTTKILGNIKEWEPDTIRVDLSRRGIEPSPGLMAKLLAAQTIVQHSSWATDHDVFFAFCLACDGIPADAEALTHPTVEQLCWGIEELAFLLKFRPNEDDGFDPDTVDPAIATVLHEDGWVYAPAQLRFVQTILERLTHDPKLTDQVRNRWTVLAIAPSDTFRREDSDEDPLSVQLARLTDARHYVEEHLLSRARQISELSS